MQLFILTTISQEIFTEKNLIPSFETYKKCFRDPDNSLLRPLLQKPMFTKSLYVQVRENQFEVRNVDDSRSIQRKANPGFSHQRILIDNFTAAQECLKAALSEARGSGFALLTSVVIHPLEKIDGGLTQVEERLFHELAAGAGAAKVFVWVGAPLSDAEVISNSKEKGTVLFLKTFNLSKKPNDDNRHTSCYC